MGKAARRRRSAPARRPRSATNPPPEAARDPRREAEAALGRLLRVNAPGRVSLAGAYAFGYGALGIAQQEDDEPEWFSELDPLDTLVLGTARPSRFRDRYEFGNARTAWLRVLRATPRWQGIERFIGVVVQASEDHQLPVDDGELMLLVAGRLEDAGLDQRKLPAALLPATSLAKARFVVGPDTDVALPEPPVDADAQVARLWTGAEVGLPPDGTPADALRDGLSMLARLGLAVRHDPRMLLPALYASLVAGDDERLDDAAERAYAWAVGLRSDSPLVPVVDLILRAGDDEMDIDDTLRHLFGLPAFTQPAPAEDLRFTSAPGGALVTLAFELGHRQVITRDSKVVRLDADGAAMLQTQVAAFEAKFGRPPRPDDPLFFDPDADEPQPAPLVGMEATTTAMLEAAGVCGAWIYACQHTGGLLPRPDGSFNTQADADEWQEAVDRYLRLHPDESVDPDAELARLGRMQAIAGIDMAARHPQFGAHLVTRLQSGPDPGDQVEVIADFLTDAASTLIGFLHDPPTAAAARELARSWSGADLARRVDAAAAGDPADAGLDVLLAAAAAKFAVPDQ